MLKACSSLQDAIYQNQGYLLSLDQMQNSNIRQAGEENRIDVYLAIPDVYDHKFLISLPLCNPEENK